MDNNVQEEKPKTEYQESPRSSGKFQESPYESWKLKKEEIEKYETHLHIDPCCPCR